MDPQGPPGAFPASQQQRMLTILAIQTKVEKKKVLSAGDKRKQRKERLAKKKRGEDVDDEEF